MNITAEIASLYRGTGDSRAHPEDPRPQPVYASATLRPGLPDRLPQQRQQALGKKAAALGNEASVPEERQNRRQSERQTDAQGDRRRQAQAVLIDTRIRRSRRQVDLAAVIDFEI